MNSTATSSSSITYSNSKPSIEQGWECPRCGRINAPWVRNCDCRPENNWNRSTITTAKNGSWSYTTIGKTDDTYIATEESIGGNDYWDPISHTYRNTLKDNLNNIKG